MEKTLNFELSKKLSDNGLLDNIETLYSYNDLGQLLIGGDSDFKTLTLEEVIEFLPETFCII